MKIPSHPILLALSAVIALMPSARANVLASYDFNSGYTDTNVIGQGGSGTDNVGLTGTFNNSFGAPSAVTETVTAATGLNNLTYNVSGGGTISSSNVLQVNSPAGYSAVADLYDIGLSSNITAKTIYMSVLVNPVAETSTNTDLLFYLTPSSVATGATGSESFGVINGQAGVAYYNNTALFGGGALPTDTATLIVASFNWSSTANSYTSMSLWENPTATSQGTPLLTEALTGTNNQSFDAIGLASANLAPNSIIDVGSLTIGTTFGDVVPALAAPEPSTWALFALGGLIFLMGRSRFRRLDP